MFLIADVVGAIGEVSCDNEELKTIFYFIKQILLLIQILIPVGLIIWGTIDLGKAVISGDEKAMQENQKVLLKRVIAAILVFFMVAIVTFLMGFVGNEQWKVCWDAAEKSEKTNPLGNP